jgi:hypothetical protein
MSLAVCVRAGNAIKGELAAATRPNFEAEKATTHANTTKRAANRKRDTFGNIEVLLLRRRGNDLNFSNL